MRRISAGGHGTGSKSSDSTVGTMSALIRAGARRCGSSEMRDSDSVIGSIRALSKHDANVRLRRENSELLVVAMRKPSADGAIA
ncbi:MAG: hypothetical protein BroJett007_04900 [Chloroflexota bacterium]|nr:MAG: hypothetical protein BroJett007_04900 [Chloroflexota bacterium]